jgi:hypothetical protein
MNFKTYNQFLNESLSKDEIFDKASEAVKDTILKEILIDCEEGKNPCVRLINTETAKSYVGVSISPDNLFSDLYVTTDPKIALVATIMKDANTEEIEKIRDIILDKNSGYLRYDVFAGENAMTPREIADKYNFQYRTTNGDGIPYYTATPIVKPFHVY